MASKASLRSNIQYMHEMLCTTVDTTLFYCSRSQTLPLASVHALLHMQYNSLLLFYKNSKCIVYE